MTIDFSGAAGVLTIYRTQVLSVPDRFFLRSKYDNEEILNGEDVYLTNKWFPLIEVTTNERYQQFTWTYTNSKLQNDDIGGYYEITFQAGAIPIPQLQRLVKVKNAFISDGITDDTVVHISDNEQNEQYTLFR
jgi:hypothetical protein